MPSTRDIRRRIKSVKNTAQITKAMQMVASAKMRKAQMAALAGRPYVDLMNKMLAAATASAGEFTHPLMEQRPIAKRAVILVSTDKGLCGGLNTNLLREAGRFDAKETVFLTAGRKGDQWTGRAKRTVAERFTYHDNPRFTDALAICKKAADLFSSGEVDQVDVVFTNFISTLNQKPAVRQLLPIVELKPLSADLKVESTESHPAVSEYQFEPTASDVLGNLLPKYVSYQVYQVLLEAKASEHSARMVAMKNATDNAKQLIKDLTLEYNKIRQANITKELLEITSAAMAMGS
jgi:F-type H+-transporting ATPase subunit gamma